MKYISMRQVIEAVFGEYTRPAYDRIRYAVFTGVIHPNKVGRSWLFTRRDIDTLRRHFSERYESVRV
jgi:hypothetical protein